MAGPIEFDAEAAYNAMVALEPLMEWPSWSDISPNRRAVLTQLLKETVRQPAASPLDCADH